MKRLSVIKMSGMDEKSKMQKITRMLESGGTMLATSHECGAPMFRYQGKVLCPVCDTQIETGLIKSETLKRPLQKGTAIFGSQEKGQEKDVATTTRAKIQDIAASLESETDLQRIKDKLECIEIGIRILKSLEV